MIWKINGVFFINQKGIKMRNLEKLNVVFQVIFDDESKVKGWYKKEIELVFSDWMDFERFELNNEGWSLLRWSMVMDDGCEGGSNHPVNAGAILYEWAEEEGWREVDEDGDGEYGILDEIIEEFGLNDA